MDGVPEHGPVHVRVVAPRPQEAVAQGGKSSPLPCRSVLIIRVPRGGEPGVAGRHGRYFIRLADNKQTPKYSSQRSDCSKSRQNDGCVRVAAARRLWVDARGWRCAAGAPVGVA